MSKPSIGRIVHFYPAVSDQQARHNGAQCVPAIIVSVGDKETGSCNLRVFQDGNNMLWRASVLNKEHAGEGQSHWDWPVIDESDFLGDVVEVEGVDISAIVREEVGKALAEIKPLPGEVQEVDLDARIKEMLLKVLNDPEYATAAISEATQPEKVEETEASQAPTEETTKTETKPKAGKKS